MKHVNFCSVLAFLAICCLLLGLCLDAALEKPDLYLSPETTRDIFAKFDREVRYIEQTHHVTLDTLDEASMELIKTTAINGPDAPGYRFGPFMDELALEILKQDHQEEKARSKWWTGAFLCAFGAEGAVYALVVVLRGSKRPNTKSRPAGCE